MKVLPKSQLLRFVEQAFHLARRAIGRDSSKFSKRRYTLHQHIVLLCLKVRKNTTYRTLLDELIEMPRIWSAFDLEELPSLRRCVRRLTGLIWLFGRFFLISQSHLKELHEANEADDSAVESHTSRGHEGNAIIDLYVTTTRKHDSQTAPLLIKRNTNEVAVLLGDKGYDDQKVRALAHEENVRPVIKHREFSPLHKAWNARLNADLYGQRSQNEAVNSHLKRKYGTFVRSRH